MHSTKQKQYTKQRMLFFGEKQKYWLSSDHINALEASTWVMPTSW